MPARTQAVLAVLALTCASCGGDGGATAAVAPEPHRAMQRERLARLPERQNERRSALAAVDGQRRRATAELFRLKRVRGRDVATQFDQRYGSDGTGDPPGWVQAGSHATRAPNTTSEAIAQFHAAETAGRI